MALLVGVVAGVWLPLPLSGVRVVLVVVWALAERWDAPRGPWDA